MQAEEGTLSSGFRVPAQGAMLMALTWLAGGCATTRPCDPQSIPQQLSSQPPNPCRVDGCSLAPDFDFSYCCDRHDVRYWPGGCSSERRRADREFRQCMEAADHRLLAGIYYYGVRIGGSPYLPTPWRWGFGWDYPHPYQACSPE